MAFFDLEKTSKKTGLKEETIFELTRLGFFPPPWFSEEEQNRLNKRPKDFKLFKKYASFYSVTVDDWIEAQKELGENLREFAGAIHRGWECA